MRPVDMGNTAGYLAITASSDGRAWALDNEGVACVYDDASTDSDDSVHTDDSDD